MSHRTGGLTNKIRGPVYGVIGDEVTDIDQIDTVIRVWQIEQEYAGAGHYEICIKHATMGKSGAFYITAWTDTDGDNLPDKEIGRSALKTASKPNQWSSWDFETKHYKIFVGYYVHRAKTKVFYKMDGLLRRYSGLENKVYATRQSAGMPHKKASPRYANIRVTKIIY